MDWSFLLLGHPVCPPSAGHDVPVKEIYKLIIEQPSGGSIYYTSLRPNKITFMPIVIENLVF